MKILLNDSDTPFGNVGLLHIVGGPNQAKFDDYCQWAITDEQFADQQELENHCDEIEIETADAEEIERVENALHQATTPERELLAVAIAARKNQLGINDDKE